MDPPTCFSCLILNINKLFALFKQNNHHLFFLLSEAAVGHDPSVLSVLLFSYCGQS